jgi:hypothetical protein
MTKHVLMLTAVTFALVFGAIGVRAEEDSDDSAMMRQGQQVQQTPGDEDDTGTMGHGWGKHGMMGHGGMMRPFAMRMIFALMDRDGDGTISLQEFQTAHESIFKAMDADKDGTVSLQEMLDFMRGTDKSQPPH